MKLDRWTMFKLRVFGRLYYETREHVSYWLSRCSSCEILFVDYCHGWQDRLDCPRCNALHFARLMRFKTPPPPPKRLYGKNFFSEAEHRSEG